MTVHPLPIRPAVRSLVFQVPQGTLTSEPSSALVGCAVALKDTLGSIEAEQSLLGRRYHQRSRQLEHVVVCTISKLLQKWRKVIYKSVLPPSEIRHHFHVPETMGSQRPIQLTPIPHSSPCFSVSHVVEDCCQGVGWEVTTESGWENSPHNTAPEPVKSNSKPSRSLKAGPSVPPRMRGPCACRLPFCGCTFSP